MLLFVVNKLVNDAKTYITVFSSGRRYQAAKSFSKVNIYGEAMDRYGTWGQIGLIFGLIGR